MRTSQILGGLCREEFFLGVAMKNHKVTALLFGVIVTASAAKAQQPPPLRVNVPYTCPGNMIVVVKHCEMRGGAEVCSLVKGAPNGPLGNEISMPKAQAAALGARGVDGERGELRSTVRARLRRALLPVVGRHVGVEDDGHRAAVSVALHLVRLQCDKYGHFMN